MDSLLRLSASKIPASIRKHILQEGFIDKAVNVMEVNTPMEYLFDVYAEFIDVSGEYDDWTCYKCRAHVLEDFQKFKPFLIELNNGNQS